MVSFLLLGVVVLGLFSRAQTRHKVVSVQEAYKMLTADTSVVLLDVRTAEEHRQSHLENSLLIPVQEIERRVGELAPYKAKTIVAYCRTGNRSGKAAEFLGGQGFTVVNMEGGIVKWTEAHLPVVRGK